MTDIPGSCLVCDWLSCSSDDEERTLENERFEALQDSAQAGCAGRQILRAAWHHSKNDMSRSPSLPNANPLYAYDRCMELRYGFSMGDMYIHLTWKWEEHSLTLRIEPFTLHGERCPHPAA
jgi:hypothetical protein